VKSSGDDGAQRSKAVFGRRGPLRLRSRLPRKPSEKIASSNRAVPGMEVRRIKTGMEWEMKVLCVEGVTTRSGTESSVAGREGGGEALRGPRSATFTAHAEQFSEPGLVVWMRAVVEEGRRPYLGSDDQEAPRPRRMVAGVCHRMCMSHQKDQDAT
jgi:hypothetical protein